MLRKRLIGVVTVLNGWAVQSFGYQKYLPLGKPECLVENLDRWGADEIIVQVIDRSKNDLGPDLDLIKKIAKSGISTPLVYGGGIASESDAVEVVRAGADRISIDALLYSNSNEVKKIASRLGGQAVIASIPAALNKKHLPVRYNYLTKKYMPVDESLCQLFSGGSVSEALLIDHENEGAPKSFDFRLVDLFPEKNVPLILFGGLSDAEQIEGALKQNNVSATAVGNFLSYSEHAVQQLKSKLVSNPVRPAFYNEKSLILNHD